MSKLPPLPGNAKLICEIPGFELFTGYAIDTSGNVWSCKLNKIRIIKPILVKGYAVFNAYYSPSSFKILKIHRLVALAFIPNPENKPEVNHKDGNKSNNNLPNLEWATPSENQKHAVANGLHGSKKMFGENHGRSKLSLSNVEFIKQSYAPRKELAQKYGVSRQTIDNIKSGRNWSKPTDPLRAKPDVGS